MNGESGKREGEGEGEGERRREGRRRVGESERAATLNQETIRHHFQC